MKTCSKCQQNLPFERFTVDRQKKDGLRSNCKDCANYSDPLKREAASKWKAANPDKVRAGKHSYYWRNADQERSAKRKDYAKHRDKRLAARRAAYAKNPAYFLEKTKATHKANPDIPRRAKAAWKARNPGYLRADRAARRAIELRATPIWANASAIRIFYDWSEILSAVSGERHHVDHIIPLRNKLVCGLHNEFNLQILTATENIAKNNRFTPG